MLLDILFFCSCQNIAIAFFGTLFRLDDDMY